MALERTVAHFRSLGGFLTRGNFIFNKKNYNDQGSPPSLVFNGPREYNSEDLRQATNNFDLEKGLGRGGARNVYRGVLKDGSCVAVKVIQNQAREAERDFIAELGTLGYVRHRNLVPLRGWCFTKEKLFLVYEYMPNGSLDQLLFYVTDKVLDWGSRYRLVRGLAEGLLYLHEGVDTPIVHRDLKASNVMVDSDWNARLGDFGLARLIYAHTRAAKDTPSLPHLYTARFGNATGAGGTFGYTAPECFHGRSIPTVESDVFSFGLVVLEIVCGRRAVDYVEFPDSPVLVDWVRNLQERLWLAVDEGLGGAYKQEEAIRLLQVGLLCSHSEPTLRPNMRQVVHMCFETIEVPKLPSFSSLIPYQTLLGNAISYDDSTKSSSVACFACLSLNKKEDGYKELVGVPQEYSWREICKATQNFSKELGIGWFGTVYEGTLSDGSRVAVKLLHRMYGFSLERGSLITEIRTFECIRHKNLVPFKGWCAEGGEACLIYEYMPNGNVGKLLHAAGDEAPWLGWDERFKIILQVAEALLYLHEGCERSIVHLDVKPNTILLDEDMNARLSALGFSSFVENFDGNLRGSRGYIAPELLLGGKLLNISPAVDVYSFGMLVLEVVSGRQPSSLYKTHTSIASFKLDMLVQNQLEQGIDHNQLEQGIDAKLRQRERGYSVEQSSLLLHLGLLCTQREAKCRPSMRVVVDILVGAILCPPPPRFSIGYRLFSPSYRLNP